MPLPLIAAAAPGIIKAAGSLVGGRARRKEQESAKAELAQRRQAYETFEFKDPSAQMTNPFEDLTVNQQQAQFQSQQQQQALSSTLSGMQAAAGGSGIAALAQAMAGQQSQNLQASAASIGQQESANQMAAAQGQQNLQAARAQGQQYVQEQEFGRTETLLGMSQQRKAAADAARAAATQDLVGGIAEAAGGALGAMGPGKIPTKKLASGKLASKKLIKENPSRFIKNKSGQFQDVNAAFAGGATMPDVQIKQLGG
jgi:hypothetical protein